MKILNIILSLLFSSSYFPSGDKADPEKYFGSQYSDALIKVKENKDILQQAEIVYDTDMQIAISVVFPEMLRYSLWKDLFETKALETLYVAKGPGAADFSIGWFQMKPSFAERIEQEIARKPDNRILFKELLHYNADSADIKGTRMERISKLKSFKTQVQYLMAFVITAKRILDEARISDNDQLIYLTALYNRGLDCKLSEIKKFADNKSFPYGPGHENPFSYYELAEYFYKHHSLNTLK